MKKIILLFSLIATLLIVSLPWYEKSKNRKVWVCWYTSIRRDIDCGSYGWSVSKEKSMEVSKEVCQKECEEPCKLDYCELNKLQEKQYKIKSPKDVK